MATLYVCPLSCLHRTVDDVGASHVLSLLNVGTPVERPLRILSSNHLFVGVSDIVEPLEGHVLPAAEHVHELVRFVRGWPRQEPLVVHCFAGISRSTAAAFIAACALAPDRGEGEIARLLRQASPSATPNRRLVALADEILGRDGRMVAAVDEIGRGSEAFEGIPFRLGL